VPLLECLLDRNKEDIQGDFKGNMRHNERRKLFNVFDNFVLTIVSPWVKSKGKDHPRTGHEGPEGE
jgi:hypothetical protein